MYAGKTLCWNPLVSRSNLLLITSGRRYGEWTPSISKVCELILAWRPMLQSLLSFSSWRSILNSRSELGAYLLCYSSKIFVRRVFTVFDSGPQGRPLNSKGLKLLNKLNVGSLTYSDRRGACVLGRTSEELGKETKKAGRLLRVYIVGFKLEKVLEDILFICPEARWFDDMKLWSLYFVV